MATAPDYEKIAESVQVDEVVLADGRLPSLVSEQPEREIVPENDPRFQGIASARGYDQSYSRLKVVHYSHDAMIDIIVGEPTVKQNELAAMFGKSVPWISRIIGSDAFQAALAKRRADISDPYLIASIEERFKGVVTQSLEIVAQKLQDTQNVDLALKTLDVGVKALGYGARGGQSGNGQTNQFIIQLPSKANDASEWVENRSMKQLPSSKD